MKNTLTRTLVLGLCILSTPFCSASVSPSQIAADANWVVYADLNAIRTSALGKELMEMIRKEQMEKTGGLLGVNAPKVLETIGSITAYGTAASAEPNSENGILLIQGAPELKKIAEALLIQQSLEKPEDIKELKDFPFAAYGIADKSPKATKGAQVVVAFPPEPVILISKSKGSIAKSLEVLRGKSESLEKTPEAALKAMVKAASESLVFAGGTAFSESSAGTHGKPGVVLKLATSGMFSLQESGENTVAQVALKASSDETAGKLMKILQGMTAVLSLAESTDKQLTEFLNSVVVDKQNETVSLKLAYSSSRVSEILKNIQQHSAARKYKANGPDSSDSKASTKVEKGEK